MSRSMRSLVLASILLLACSTTPSSDSQAVASNAKPASPGILAHAAHVDARVGTPSFVWITRDGLPRYTTAMEAATDTLKRVGPTFKLNAEALATVGTPLVQDTGKGPIVARFEQRIGDIEIFRGGLSLAMNRAFEPVAATGLVAARLAGKEKPFTLTSVTALERAWTHIATTAQLGTTPSFRSIGTADKYEKLVADGLVRPSRAKKVFFPNKDGVVPGWYVEIAVKGHAWSFVVAADDGRILFQNDLVRYDSTPFTYKVWADPTTKFPYNGPQGNSFDPHPTGKPDNTKLTYAPEQTVTLGNYPFSKNDPWLAADATATQGNNVDAYSDRFGDDGYSPESGDVRSNTTSTRTFGNLYDTGKSPDNTSTNVQASITSAFYLTNFLHDWYYDSGFDETHGNHQTNNFGRGGAGNDALRVEVMDQSGTNNANAQTPPDGDHPVLQMYIFSGPSNATLDVTGIGMKPVGIGSFGKTNFDLTAPIALAVDGQGADPNDGCEAVTNNLSGKIALVHRGTCSFIQKATAAQAAGAVGVIIANVATSADANNPPFMGGTDSANDVQIPAVSVSYPDGQVLQNTGIGANAHIKREAEVNLDGALDPAILGHEWGHVLSNRLVSDGNGLTTNQSGGLGEGWADFSAMMILVREADASTPQGAGWAGSYGMGSYAMSGQADIYYGVRRVAYSTDMTKDPLTLKHIMNGVPLPTTAPINFGEDGGSNSEVHNTGEIWVTMLYECYAALLHNYSFAEAQTRMKRYLVASLSLTPPDPTILEARDAVLAAAYAADQKDFQLFWAAFAKRGAGVGAKGPGKESADNSGVVESYALGASLEIVEATVTDDILTCDHDGILDPGEVGTVHVKVKNGGSTMLGGPTVKLTTKTKGIVLDAKLPLGGEALAPFATKDFDIVTKISAGDPNAIVDYRIEVADPTLGTPMVLDVMGRYNADEGPDASATDTVDTKKSAWKTAGDDSSDAPKFGVVRDGSNGYWSVLDTYAPSDRQLVSPKFTIEGATFGLEFKHRWSFRFSTRRQVDVDGGVVEISTDGGKTWNDISTVGTIDYNTTLDAGRGDGPIGGRKGFGHSSEDYPNTWHATKVAVTLPAHPDAVQIRFRAGTSSGFNFLQGWDIDEIALTGITSTPFYGFVPHADQCDPKGPTVTAAGPLTVHARDLVMMSATADGAGDLGYGWLQIAGPGVAVGGIDTANPAFVAPDMATMLSFQVRANNGKLVSAPAQLDVVVLAAPATNGGDDSGCGIGRGTTASTGVAAFGVLLGLGAVVRRRRRPL